MALRAGGRALRLLPGRLRAPAARLGSGGAAEAPEGTAGAGGRGCASRGWRGREQAILEGFSSRNVLGLCAGVGGVGLQGQLYSVCVGVGLCYHEKKSFAVCMF